MLLSYVRFVYQMFINMYSSCIDQSKDNWKVTSFRIILKVNFLHMEIQYWYPQTLLIFTISGNKLNNKYLIFSTIPKSLKQRQQTLDYTEGPINKMTIQINWQHRQHKTTEKNKDTTQYVLDTTIPKQTQITQIRHAPSYKQLEVKTNRSSFIYGNRKIYTSQHILD